MPINNKRRHTTQSIQSDPVNHGNDLNNDVENLDDATNVSVVVDSSVNNSKDPLLDSSKIKFSSVKKSRTQRGQKTSYAIAKSVSTNSFSRNYSNSMVSAIGIRDFSMANLYNPYYNKVNKPVLPKKNISSSSSRSEVKIGSLWGMDQYLLESSISNLRPEIIASFDWMPARTSSGRKDWIEMLLEFRWTLRMLQIENVEETIKRLKDVDLGGAFSRLEAKYEYYTEQEQIWLEWREKILDVLNNAKKSLDIKDNAASLKASTSKYYSAKFSNKSSASKNVSLKELFINDLGFSEEGYERFSNSKVYGQLIWDLYYACRYHSPQLITSKNYHRSKDLNSTSINARIIPKSKNYQFRLWKIGNKDWGGDSKKRKFDATQANDYFEFLASLPNDGSDKIKVLTTSISNELTISAGIGYLTNTSIGNRFNVDLSNPLWYPLGRVRKDILTDGWPTGSLSSLVLLKDDSDRLILPFETRDFSDVKGRMAVAGSRSMIDGIMRFGNIEDGLNYKPFYKFGTELNETTDDVAKYLDDLLNLDNTEHPLQASKIFSSVLLGINRSITGIVNTNYKNEQQLTIASLFKLANENKKIKHTLLRYILEIRDARDQLIADAGREEFLEPDADNPRPRPPSPTISLSRFGSFSPYQALSAQMIQQRYGISANLASSLVASTSSFGEMFKRASQAKAQENQRRLREYYALARKWQRTSLWLSILARSAIDSQRRPPSETTTRSVLKMDDQAIVSALRKSARDSSSYSSPFTHIIKLARQLQKDASELANRDSAGGRYMSQQNLTKYNGWDENALIAAIFEIYCSLYSRFIDAEMVSHNENIYVKYIPETNSRFKVALKDSLSVHVNSNEDARAKQLKQKKESYESTGDVKLTKDMLEGKLSVLDALQSASNQSSQLAVFSDVYSFLDCFEKEIEFKALLISHLQSIGNSVGRNADAVKILFNTNIEDLSPKGDEKYQSVGRYVQSSRIRRYLAHKTKSQFGRDMLRSLTEHQVALQRVAAKKLTRKENDPSYMPSEMCIEAEELVALRSFLASPNMRGITGGNIRVMTVGIPCETIDILQNPPYTIGEKRNSEIGGAKDVFEVHVHKRDLEYEDIIFKPKKFIYDRSLFLMPNAFSELQTTTRRGNRRVRKTWNFDQVVKKAKFTNATYANLSETDAVSIYKANKYRNIPEAKRTEMISNHMSNRLLHLYYKLLCGLNMDENVFLREGDWAQLLIDSDAGRLLQLSQMANETMYWIYTGTVPVGNLLIDEKIQNQDRKRVATFKDSEIWTRPTSSQLSRLARDLRVARYGYMPAYKKYRKIYSVGEVHQILGRARDRSRKRRYNRQIEAATVRVARSGFGKKVRYANPPKETDYYNTNNKNNVKTPNTSHPIWKKWVEIKAKIKQNVEVDIPRVKKHWEQWSQATVATLINYQKNPGSSYFKQKWQTTANKAEKLKLERIELEKYGNKLRDELKVEKSARDREIKQILQKAQADVQLRRKSVRVARKWNKINQKRNKQIRKDNEKIRQQRTMMAMYQRQAYSHIAKRFYRKKPRMSPLYLQHFRMVCASSIMGPCAMINKVLAPRTFDRVLMIPVDPDDFEINMRATKNLLGSKSAEEKKEFENMITISEDNEGNEIVKLKPRRRSENYSSFNDFFVTISSVTGGEK